MTLNTFHFASSTSITEGVPRLEKILNMTSGVYYQFACADPEGWVRKHHHVRLSDISSAGEEVEGEMDSFWAFPDPDPPPRSDPYTRLELFPFCDAQALQRLGYTAYVHVGRKMIVHVYDRIRENTTLRGIEGIEAHVERGRVVTNAPLAYLLEDPEVDWNTLRSNSPRDVSERLGLAAGRGAVELEIVQTLASYGVSLAPMHLNLLADRLAWTGKLLPISRHGMRKWASPLRRASFEEMAETFTSAALKNQTDFIQGVSESIMVGAEAKFGRGECLPDAKMLLQALPPPEEAYTPWVDTWRPTQYIQGEGVKK